MKKALLIITILIIATALFFYYRHRSDSTHSRFVREAVVKAETVEHIRTLLAEAGIKVTVEKIVVPEGSFHAFPPDTYTISVPESAQEKALSLIRQDAPKGKYWIQAGPVLDTIDPLRPLPKPTARASRIQAVNHIASVSITMSSTNALPATTTNK